MIARTSHSPFKSLLTACAAAGLLMAFAGNPGFAQEENGDAPASPPSETQPAGSPEQPEAARVTDTEEVLPEELSIKERVRREEQYLLGETELQKGRELLAEKEYEKALKRFDEAIKHFRNAGQTQAIQERIAVAVEAKARANVAWADGLTREGKRLAETDKYDTAIEKLRQAIELNPDKSEEYRKQILAYQDARKETEFRADTAKRNVMPDKDERDREIEKLVEQGRILFEDERLTDARAKFEDVLIIDPYNVAAIRYLRKVGEALSRWGEERRIMTRKEKLAEGAWKWSAPVKTSRGERADEVRGQPVEKQQVSKVLGKLRSIVIPELNFTEVTVPQVVKFLRNKSEQLDPEGEGVNILLYLSQEQGRDEEPEVEEFPEAETDWFEEEEAPTRQPSRPSPGSRTITLEMNNVTLEDAIKYVTNAANLDYVVERNAVIIADKDAGFGREMSTRFYAVKVGIFKGEKAQQETQDLGGWGVEEDEDVSVGGGSMSSDEVKQYFINFGVNFPEDSTVAYDRRTSKLIVHNTEENLRKIEEILRELNITPTQVMIEAKFVEVSQNDLEGLGMQWAMLDSVGDADSNFEINPGGFIGPPSREVFPTEYERYISDYDDNGNPKYEFEEDEQGNKIPLDYKVINRPGSQLFEAALSTGVRTLGSALTSGGGSGVLNFRTVMGSVELGALVHAIDQMKSSDVLSAPKVTTTSNNTAVIRMVQERYFPESWDNPDLETTGGDNTTTSLNPPTPVFGATRDIGVILEVTPQVESDGYTIGLDLRPEVIEFLGYDTSFNTTANIGGDPVEFKYQMPIIAARTVQTNVIIYDGETVVLGGMIREQIQSFNDKIPILGDIPLVGRLFRNEGESVSKRNLLIFVTARLVDPAGQPQRVQESPGLPDFRR